MNCDLVIGGEYDKQCDVQVMKVAERVLSFNVDKLMSSGHIGNTPELYFF